MLFKKLRRRGLSILPEPHIPTQHSYMKPDLVILADDKIYVVEATVCDPNRMSTAHTEKKQNMDRQRPFHSFIHILLDGTGL